MWFQAKSMGEQLEERSYLTSLVNKIARPGDSRRRDLLTSKITSRLLHDSYLSIFRPQKDE